MKTIKINVDGRDIESQPGRSVLEAALNSGIYIPHLCYHPQLTPIGECGLCVIEIQGIKELVSSCMTSAVDGMVVKTKSQNLDRARRISMETMLAGHPAECTGCNKYLNCELQSVRQFLGIGEELNVKRRVRPFSMDESNPLFVHDMRRCIFCKRCIRACHELRGANVLYYKTKGDEAYIGTENGLSLSESDCIFCGACAEVCPTGAIRDKEEVVKGKNRKTALVPCKYTCPAEVDVPRYIRFIGENNDWAAAAVIREKVPFPGVLSYVCSRPCESACRRGEVNEPVAIRELKRYAVHHDPDKAWEKISKKKTATGKRVAVVGSGPAGLTAAYYLSNQGHRVTVFESLPSVGGMMRYGIPEYRLPRDVLDSEIKTVEKRGVEIKTSTRVESIDRLFEQGYGAIVVAVGTHRGLKPQIVGVNSGGVFVGVELLKAINSGGKIDIGKNVVVVGGGNVALDCARVVRRLGAEACVACLECREQMPAAREEIEDGEKEGIRVLASTNVSKILSEDGKVTGIELQEVESFCITESKEVEICLVEGSPRTIQADTVIFAVGQRPEMPEGFGLTTVDDKYIELDPYTFTTNRDGVFAAGDAVIGPSSVVAAIASGRKAAMAADSYLGGDGNIEESLAPAVEVKAFIGKKPGFTRLKRFADIPNNLEDFSQRSSKPVEDTGQEAARCESNRCLQCDMRLKITPIRFWGDY